MYDYGDGENGGLGRPFMSGSNAYSATMLNENNAEGNAINAMGFAELSFP